MRRAVTGLQILLVLWLVGCDHGGSSPRISSAKSSDGVPAAGDTAGLSVPGAELDRHSDRLSRDGAADVPSEDSRSARTETRGEFDSSPPRDSSGKRPRRNSHNLQSGTLTAGSFDDNEQFDSFRQFMSLAMQQNLPHVPVDDRIMIVVRNGRGEPIGDARVVIATTPRQTQSGSNQAADSIVFDGMTGSDGRVSFLPSLDRAGHVREFAVTVRPRQGAPITRILRAEQQTWHFALQDAEPAFPTGLDLALVIDTTGSMGDELEYLKVEIDSIAAEVHERFPNVQQRYALILYRDKGDQYVTRTFDFTGSLDEFRDRLAAQVATGGGDYPEAVHAALEQAGRLSWRDHGTARVMFLVGDAPPHDGFMRPTLHAVNTLRSKNVRLFPVAASGADIKCEFVMRSAAFLTLGQYAFLTDHSGVGNAHAQPHVPAYEVEHLNKLMVRMIASELSGKRLRPGEVLARRDSSNDPYAGTTSVLPGPIAGPTHSRSASLPTRWLLLAVAIIGWLALEAFIERCKRPTWVQMRGERPA